MMMLVHCVVHRHAAALRHPGGALPGVRAHAGDVQPVRHAALPAPLAPAARRALPALPVPAARPRLPAAARRRLQPLPAAVGVDTPDSNMLSSRPTFSYIKLNILLARPTLLVRSI